MTLQSLITLNLEITDRSKLYPGNTLLDFLPQKMFTKIAKSGYEIRLEPTFTSYNNMEGIAKLTDLEILNLSSCNLFRRDCLCPLSRLSHLTNLSLANNELNSLYQLSSFTNLKYLDLRNNHYRTSIQDSVYNLASLTNLTSLNLSGARFHSRALKKLTSLTDLIVTHASLKKLPPNLISLTMYDPKLNDKNIIELTTLTKLQRLNIVKAPNLIGKDVLFHLSKLTNLHYLCVPDGTSEDVMSSLRGFTHLTRLDQLNK